MEAWAQNKVYRPAGTMFVKPKVGLSNYGGDNEKSPLNFNGDAFSVGTPFSGSIEVGYQFTVPYSVSFALAFGSYPVVTQFPPPNLRTDNAVSEDPASRTSLQIFGRWTFAEPTQRTAFFLNSGLVGTFGKVRQKTTPCCIGEENGFGFGPVLGLGLDIAMNARTSFFLEVQSGLHFPDDALDGNADNGFGGVDVFSGVGLGLKVNFKSAMTPVGITSLTCPSGNVMLGEDVPFSAETNVAATEPVTYTWNFSDGGSASDRTATHAFSSDGTHEVTFTAENAAGVARYRCTVTVVEPASVAGIVTDKSSVSTCDTDPSVTFSANVRGTAPMTYSWDFGDGNTSTEANPQHTYGATGTYEVSVSVTNVGGTDEQTVSFTVTNEGCMPCDIASMNSVFFDRNSTELTDEGQVFLTENVEILRSCEFAIRVEGYSSRFERRPQQLSEDRAQAVAEFYMEMGISEDRMAVEGMGNGGQTSKKSGANQFQRVDTVPVR